MAREQTRPPTFTEDEAARLIREATERSLKPGGSRQLTTDDVKAMARELGLSDEAVDEAIRARGRREAEKKRTRGALMALAGHAGTYAIVIAGLAVIDAATGPGWWVQWPAMGWGIGVALQTFGTLMAVLKKSRP